MSSASRLNDPIDFDVNRLVFSDPEEMKLPEKAGGGTYQRVNIKVKSQNGKGNSDLLLVFDRCSSFGVSTKYGTSVGLIMLDRDNPTERQTKTVDLLKSITTKCEDWLLEHKADVGKPKLNREKLQDYNQENGIGPLKYKKLADKITIDDTKSPTMSLKLMPKGKGESGFLTRFYSEDETDENGKQLLKDPMEFEDVRCLITPIVKIEGIFIGATISIQCKLYECEIKAIESNSGSLLQAFRSIRNEYKPTPVKQVSHQVDDNLDVSTLPDDVSSPGLQVSDDEEEEQEPEPEKKPEPVQKRRTKK